MIRFACPGCSATFTVDDSKGGKAGKCPKCNSQFLIPEADLPASPPPPKSAPKPAPAPAEGPVEIKPCPKCQTALTVESGDLGLDVECPTCSTVFKAERPGVSKQSKAPPAPPPPPPKKSALESTDPTGKPRSSRRRDDDDEDDDRPRSRRRKDDDEDEDDRPKKRSRRDDDDDDEEEDRPRRKKRRRRNYEPHRGGMILTLGILSFVFCGIFTGIPAYIMGKGDMEKIDNGEMDPEGRGLTQAGKIMGLVSIILTVVGILFYCVLFAIIGVGGAAAGGGR